MAPRPISAARASHESRSSGRSIASLRSLVASAATREAAKPEVPIASMCSTSDWRRVEKARIASSRHALDLGHALDRLGPAHAEAGRQLVAQVGLVEVAGGQAVGAQDRLAVEGSPRAVGRAGQVGDDHVGVEVRVLGAAGAVPEGGGDEALAVLADRAAAAAAHHAGLGLEVGRAPPASSPRGPRRSPGARPRRR